MPVHDEEIKYLGFVINKQGIKPDDDKVKVIRSMPEPKTVRQVRGFIGAIGYYRRFIPAFSRIATPLIALTKKMLVSSGQMIVRFHLIR